MRNEIVHIGAGELNYEIRNIMKVVERVKALGVEVNLEKIGDPVAKGEKIPPWMKEIRVCGTPMILCVSLAKQRDPGCRPWNYEMLYWNSGRQLIAESEPQEGWKVYPPLAI